jgi:hypothetical protein
MRARRTQHIRHEQTSSVASPHGRWPTSLAPSLTVSPIPSRTTLGAPWPQLPIRRRCRCSLCRRHTSGSPCGVGPFPCRVSRPVDGEDQGSVIMPVVADEQLTAMPVVIKGNTSIVAHAAVCSSNHCSNTSAVPLWAGSAATCVPVRSTCVSCASSAGRWSLSGWAPSSVSHPCHWRSDPAADACRGNALAFPVSAWPSWCAAMYPPHLPSVPARR